MPDDNQAYFDAVFNHSFHMAAITDIHGGVLKINDLIKKICGDLANLAPGTPLWEAAWWAPFPDVRERTRQAFEKVRQGQIVEDEAPFIDKEGASRVGSRIFSPVKNKDGLIDRIFVAGLDITGQKQNKAMLATKGQFTRTILESSPILFSILRDGIIKYINGPGCNILGGASKEEFIGQHIETFVLPKYRQEIFTRLRRLNSGFTNPPADIGILKKNGQVIYVENSSLPVCYQNKKAALLMAMDVTERKLSTQALKESEAKYRSMMESMDEAAYICSQDFKIEYMNPAMEKKIGRDATGETCHMAIHNRPEQCPWCQHPKVMQGESIKTEPLIDDSGETFFISHAPIFHTDDSISKLSIYRNVTQIKQLEARLQQSQKMESLGTLAGGIAHDFNNILFPIMGLSEILLEDLPPGSPEAESAREIFNAGKRGRDLVDQILSFSRQSDRRLLPLQMQRVVKEAVKLIRATIPSDIRIQKQISPDCGKIMADPTQLHQIIMNLLTNAWHAVEGTCGDIRITLSETKEPPVAPSCLGLESPSYARLVVEDSGIGIPPDLINKIFDPYFTTKGNGKGTGLGLATVYGIVKEFNGDIQVASQPGKGTVFSLYFPIIPQDSEDGTPSTPSTVPGGHEHILVVDDEEPVVMLEKTMLQRAGYRVTARTASVEALEKFKADPGAIDLVLTDMAMPNLTGDHLAQKILELVPGIPIIICTGFSERVTPAKAQSIGIKGFLKKPIIKSELLNMVRGLLDASAL